MKIKYYISFICLFCLQSLFAQDGGNRDQNKEMKIKTETIMDIKIVPNKNLEFVFTNDEQFENGIFEPAATTIKVKANVNWQIHVNSSATHMEDAQANQMPVNVLSLAKSGETLSPLSFETPGTPIATGIRGDYKKETNKIDLDYFANPGYGYAPGSYQVDIIYTISAE